MYATEVYIGPLLFLIYINDLNNAIGHSMVHHFGDDKNIIFSLKSLKKVNKCINHDLSLLVQWLWANRISLYTNKTEIILFWTNNKKISKNLNFRIIGQKKIQLNKQNTLAYTWMKVLHGNFRLKRSKAN